MTGNLQPEGKRAEEALHPPEAEDDHSLRHLDQYNKGVAESPGAIESAHQ
jgi:hypothetical protein